MLSYRAYKATVIDASKGNLHNANKKHTQQRA